MKPSRFFEDKTGTFCLEDLKELDKRFIDRNSMVKEVNKVRDITRDLTIKEFERLIDKIIGKNDVRAIELKKELRK